MHRSAARRRCVFDYQHGRVRTPNRVDRIPVGRFNIQPFLLTKARDDIRTGLYEVIRVCKYAICNGTAAFCKVNTEQLPGVDDFALTCLHHMVDILRYRDARPTYIQPGESIQGFMRRIVTNSSHNRDMWAKLFYTSAIEVMCMEDEGVCGHRLDTVVNHICATIAEVLMMRAPRSLEEYLLHCGVRNLQSQSMIHNQIGQSRRQRRANLAPYAL